MPASAAAIQLRDSDTATTRGASPCNSNSEGSVEKRKVIWASLSGRQTSSWSHSKDDIADCCAQRRGEILHVVHVHAILAQMYLNPHITCASRKHLQHGPTGIAGAIITHDNLVREPHLGQQTFKLRAKIFFAVAGAQRHRQSRSVRRLHDATLQDACRCKRQSA